MNHPNLPTLEELCKQHALDPCTLMRETDVPHAIIDKILCGTPVLPEEAKKVFATLSRLTQQEYTLDSVYVPLNLTPQEVVSEIARLRQQIEDEFTAANRVFNSFAEVGRHQNLTRSTQNIANCAAKLDGLGGPELVVQIFEQIGTQPNETSSQATL